MVRKLFLTSLIVVSYFVLSGCSSQGSLDYRDTTEIPEGQGLLSGADGSLILVNTDPKVAKDGDLAPSAFIEWKKEFLQAGEMRQYEMWLELKKQR